MKTVRLYYKGKGEHSVNELEKICDQNNSTLIAKSSLINFYLEYVNDWLTTSRMADNYNLPEELCKKMIECGKELHELQLQRR